MELELVQAAQRGDSDAFDALAGVHVDRLFALARLILRDADAAEDATQEALVRACRDLPRLREPERFGGWLQRLLLHAVADEGRRERRASARITLLRAEPSGPDAGAGLADRDLLERAFRRLTVDQRTIVVLHHYLDLTLADTAAALGIPLGTAKSRLHGATAALRAALEADALLTTIREVIA